ncbi:MAG TPA: NAD(P)/FAD-dependent oxidoreductase [Terriglobales bacterium]|jgi:phytoene dehydrogenase-like protein|nr:NAD(P)/FAD-dependent oxidoreductase [Terriglobales bacterium]
MKTALIIGAGPNGLSAAITLVQAGLNVDIFEAEPQPGGAARTLPLTLPGYHHDFGSAVHPLAIGSPFFNSLSLENHGLEWIHSPAALAHPFDDGTAITLSRDLTQTESQLGADAKAWRNLMRPFADRWAELANEVLRPISLFPSHPFLMANFGRQALRSAKSVANSLFQSGRTKALFAGIAAHSVLSLDEPSSAAAGVLLGAALHAVGWPIPRGGAQSITEALCSCLGDLGCTVTASTRIENLAALPKYDLTLCDVTPRQVLAIAGDRLSSKYKNQLAKYQYGPAVFKVDYALRDPIPWTAQACLQAATIHIGGSFEEIAASEKAMRTGHHAERPFVLLAQPSLFDATRAPADRHTAWAYCHVPNASTFDMLPRIEAQIERFAPGFRECILARHILSPAGLEKMDANLIGGDISGGAMNLRQLLFRPTCRQYATSAPDIYLCSSSTPPGGGVHGMCGYHAAKLAINRLNG